MGIDIGPIETTDGLVLHLDGGNSRSYSGSGNTWYNLITGAIGGTMVELDILLLMEGISILQVHNI